jgi:hypothetical protein
MDDAERERTMRLAEMTNRYIARRNDPVRELAERVGSQIQALRNRAADNVVDYAKKA